MLQIADENTKSVLKEIGMEIQILKFALSITFVALFLIASCSSQEKIPVSNSQSQDKNNASNSNSGEKLFNGTGLTSWKGNDGYWSVKDGVIIGHSDKIIAKNEFIWSDIEVNDFY